MENVYRSCPQYENEDYLLRKISPNDKSDLLTVYSDKNAVPFFNCDNCGGDDFYYTTQDRMEQAISYWLLEYSTAGFIFFPIYF